ncbi:MAG: glycosyltransferase, partial [Candidatus Woesearchaeota archaeon]
MPMGRYRGVFGSAGGKTSLSSIQLAFECKIINICILLLIVMDFSVVVITFNRARQLSRCVGSILAQKFRGSYEIIIVDDGSTDDTREVGRHLQEIDGRV